MNNLINLKGDIDMYKTKDLTKKETAELLLNYKNGDKRVKEDIVFGNLKLVSFSLKFFQIPKESSYEDLFQIGIIGLLHAIERFDPNLGFQFSTYAVQTIQGEIKRFLRNKHLIKIPRSTQEHAKKITKSLKEFIDKNGFNPSSKEWLISSGLSKDEFSKGFYSLEQLQSLDQPIYENGEKELTFQDVVIDKTNFEEKTSAKLIVEESLKCLTKNEKEVIILRYFHDVKQKEIANQKGVSQAHISRVEKRALDKMKKLIS